MANVPAHILTDKMLDAFKYSTPYSMLTIGLENNKMNTPKPMSNHATNVYKI